MLDKDYRGALLLASPSLRRRCVPQQACVPTVGACRIARSTSRFRGEGMQSS
ncbi:hypothetical protein ASPFODRAFT_48845 [Aspergillus luchuensis CBS 106.47]|uniref:Uncharacterized protein n=1 Tax=Aspergillus luchuensis (strain CBS 106.47) TaxID=1137211 RepID=A0A1M3TD90_ASPLC|nr:hypothetical protein ASPFODRAFT_48845 [Aspergillus luchuensis CBS 106.47]